MVRNIRVVTSPVGVFSAPPVSIERCRTPACATKPEPSIYPSTSGRWMARFVTAV